MTMPLLAGIVFLVFFSLGNYARTQNSLRWIYFILTPFAGYGVLKAVSMLTVIGNAFLWSSLLMVAGLSIGYWIGDHQVNKQQG